ncbi:putative short chain dehydrogenase/ reductase [Rhizodiscina lignyota]|uniref:Short chain dehydrogenase/ reductase n=1 Tax=Rhizodiscina lignyota TaxID=1504668 RepID=A0A9P4IH40_9PEZI|nr:putative short chain dehydrogenase/ reductase [Rhizodiscina lignyota]
MRFTYKNGGPVDCSKPIDLAKLKGKTAIVTGGSSGLGEAMVKDFADAGAFVVIADLHPPSKQPTPDNVLFVKCDCMSWEEQHEAFKTAIAKGPNNRIDYVVTSAGISGSDLFHELDPEKEPVKPNMKILEINLLGTVYTSKLALHYFNKQGPGMEQCLILVSSIMGFLNTNGSPTYSASKFGVRGLMCCLRRFGVGRVNLIAPWFIATPLMTEAVRNHLRKDMQGQGTDFATTEDCAKCVMRIASDDSINGRSLFITPHSIAPEGFMDLDLDDYKEGSLLANLQNITGNFTHRRMPAHLQKTAASL